MFAEDGMERGGRQDGHGVLQISDVTTAYICFLNKKLCKNTAISEEKATVKDWRARSITDIENRN